MPQETKKLNCLKIRPSGSAGILLSVLFFSLFFTIVFPASVAYSQTTYQVFFPFVSKPVEITLAWDPNTEPDLAGYRLYIGLSSRNYTQVFDLGMTTQYTIRNLAYGTVYYFSLTAYNQNGLESSFSNEVRYP